MSESKEKVEVGGVQPPRRTMRSSSRTQATDATTRTRNVDVASINQPIVVKRINGKNKDKKISAASTIDCLIQNRSNADSIITSPVTKHSKLEERDKKKKEIGAVKTKGLSTNTNNVNRRRSSSVPAAKKSIDVDQSKISDYFTVRRSSRTSGNELKKKENEEIIRLIEGGMKRENEEKDLKVEDIEGKGRGVIAGHRYARGEFVVEYAGDLIEISDAKERENKYKMSTQYGCYMYYFNFRDKHYCIDATAESGRLGRLINHSRLKPNCATKVIEVKDRPRLVLVAREGIEEGEEFLYDYGDRSKESLESHPWLAL